jgi:hypothetical protein
LLDEAPPTLSRPLALINGRGYAASWHWAEVTKGDPPTLVQEQLLHIIRDDGQMFGPNEHGSLGIQIHLPDTPRDDKLWRVGSVKDYLAGQRPDCPELFHQLCSTYDYFIDFSRGFADAKGTCELSACFSLST